MRLQSSRAIVPDRCSGVDVPRIAAAKLAMRRDGPRHGRSEPFAAHLANVNGNAGHHVTAESMTTAKDRTGPEESAAEKAGRPIGVIQHPKQTAGG